ncbi:MAG: formate dehydrogenase accessory sulfurtransferase FdhD [Actinobacteria bacterium]|nr:formate dehydrogenase accessory sulfurtransferase FdhD [Actinomycetota bacterium]MSY13783.1 formate dehydrogenase accessory sulfurtransferase FdhD [Actinomycetota bacterium]MSZ03471.1 formate dehydrogenase accessory sulfurtransferase FdhD [Actinomycetota bacterium]MTB06213.1 formate dehydrogenase accessory sulfurtransferase FdhD [Actinomycetota bacterium]
MARRRMASLLITRMEGGSGRRVPDDLIVEEPMAIELDDVRVSTTMRTPGHDFELAAGFLHTEGLLAGAPVTEVRYCANGSAVESGFNIVTVSSGGLAPRPTARLTTTTSSCGLCGSASLDDLAGRLAPIDPTGLTRFDLSLLADLPDRALASQPLFDATGAVHAAVAFDSSGSVVIAREDVGRHNAVDKVVGRLLLDGALPASALALYVSGRASFEIVQKAWAAGFGTVVSVSAPTALAVDTARRAGITLVGFVRDDRFNVYSPERVDHQLRNDR